MTDFRLSPPKYAIPGAAFCLSLAVGTGGGDLSYPARVPAPVTVDTAASGGDAVDRPMLEFRGECPSLLSRLDLLELALGLRKQLAEYLGAGTRVVFEELINPDDPEEPSTLYAVALLSDEESDELLDNFILEEWSAQPRHTRLLVRIGREFV